MQVKQSFAKGSRQGAQLQMLAWVAISWPWSPCIAVSAFVNPVKGNHEWEPPGTEKNSLKLFSSHVALVVLMNCFMPQGYCLIDRIFTVRSHLASFPKAGIHLFQMFIYRFFAFECCITAFISNKSFSIWVSHSIHTLKKLDFFSPKLRHTFKLKLNSS